MEKKPNIIKDKSFDFAVRIVNLYKFLAFQKNEYVLSKQLLKSGTSIGANLEEALGAQSNKEFIDCQDDFFNDWQKVFHVYNFREKLEFANPTLNKIFKKYII